VRYENTGVNPEVVLVDLSTYQYISQYHMNSAQYHASVVAYYGSEDAILAGQHLVWFRSGNVVISYPDSSWGFSQEYSIEMDMDEFFDRYHDGEWWDGHAIDMDMNEFFDRYSGSELWDENTIDDDFYERAIIEQWFELRTPDRNQFHVRVDTFAHDPQARRIFFEEQAIQQQLNTFRNSLETLSNTDGLLFHIEVDIPPVNSRSPDGILRNSSDIYLRAQGQENGDDRLDSDEITGASEIIIHTNVDDLPLDSFFKSQPVYYISIGDNAPEQSFTTDHFIYSRLNSDEVSYNEIYLAFSRDFISTQHRLYSSTRDEYIIDISIIAASAVLALGSLIVLLVSAGRRNVLVDGVKTRSERIHFSPIDKPYLDISLVFILAWSAFIMYFAFIVSSTIWYHRNVIAMNIILAAVTLLIVPLVLYWLMTFVKRIKAGRFWKHTLIFVIVYSCLYGSLRYIVRKVKSLWAGTRLTFRVALIAIAVFCMMFFVGFIGAETRDAASIIVTAIIFIVFITVLLLHYAKRIFKLEQGARTVSEGDYDVLIDVGGGELGSIANSINNISAGINTAVEERMKSERLKTELITNVSHDIRTPLTSIITYTDLLEHEGLDSQKAPDYLDVLKQKSQRLKTLTDELFEAAKAATGNIDVNLTDLNVVSLINQVLGELDNTVKSSGFDLRVNLPDKLLARADGRLMQRVIENLLSNVFKYSLPGSRVYLDAFPVSASEVRIDIKNISASELNFDPSELTERFKRGDDSRADGGSGLGLSIVQSFVSAQGGKFEISIDGDLFKATVLLPVSPSAASDAIKS